VIVYLTYQHLTRDTCFWWSATLPTVYFLQALQEDMQLQQNRAVSETSTAKSATSAINFPTIAVTTPQLPS